MNILYWTIMLGIMIFIVPVIFKWLWNMTIPRIFNCREITKWEAFRILLIGSMLVHFIPIGSI